MDMNVHVPRSRGLAIVLALAVGGPIRAGVAAPPVRAETIELPDGRRLAGKVIGDAAAGLRFAPEGATETMRLEAGAVVVFDGAAPDPAAGFPPFRVELGLAQRLSGRLGVVDSATVRLLDVAGGQAIAVARSGAQALVQRPGEAQVLHDGFEALDAARWVPIGAPEVVQAPRVAGEHSLRVPCGGTSMTCRLAEPVGSGRLEVAFHDGGVVARGQQWFVDLVFRGGTGPETIRAVLGWEEESLAVESAGGPALAIQRLARSEGWHRLSVRFGPEQTELAVDGNELAHGRGPGGPLVEVRLASHRAGQAAPPDGLAGHFDDLRLARVAEPVGGLEVDSTQDEVRLVGGDQIFGALRAADDERVRLAVEDRDIELPWGEVSGLYFRRAPRPGRPIEGLLVRLDWRAAPGDDPRDLDQVEGALTAVSASEWTLATPYAGMLRIPRARLRRLRVLGQGRRLVLDPTSHHLGDEISTIAPVLDPPQPEGSRLERVFELDAVPPGAAFLALDVVQVVGEASGLPFSGLVKKGELRTNVQINGRPVDYLNRHITSKNETPERIRLAIPAGLLRPGTNRLRIDQVGIASDPNYLDDLGVLGIALEFDADRPAGAHPESP
jgi:hypothetical protein